MRIFVGRAHPLSASLFARVIHSRAGRLHSRSNATVELWLVNQIRKSWRYPALIDLINLQSEPSVN